MADRHLSPWTGRVTEAVHTPGVSAAVFLLFVAAGCAYIVAAKLARIDAFYVTFVPVATMVGYALTIYLARGLRLRDDQSGDNLYYMGFLFTLTSLGVSLYQFTAARAAEEIVQNFGIAIGSTIAGIGLRVIFNQMRRDPVEVERMMRLELAEAARRVRRELDSTVVEFEHHRRSAQQAAADSFAQVTEKFDQVVSRFLASLEDTTAKLAAPLEAASRRSAGAIAEATDTIGASVGGSARHLQAEIDKLSVRAGAIAMALEQTVAKLRAMQTPEQVIEIRLEPVTHSLTQAVERFAAQSDGQAAAIKAALQDANAATRESTEVIAAARKELGATAASNRVALDAASKAVVGVAEILDEFKTNSRDYVEMLRVLLENTEATMRTFTEVLVKHGLETTSQSDSLRTVLPAIEAGARSIAAAGDKIARVTDELGATRRIARRETIE